MEKMPYPPCQSMPVCTGNMCSGRCFPKECPGEWPELVGVKGEVAKAEIEKSNPYVTVIPIDDPHSVVIMNVCCNRVWLPLSHLGQSLGVVTRTPKVG